MSVNWTLLNLSSGTTSYLPVTSSVYLNAIIILVAFIILARIVDYVFEKVFLRLTAHTQTDVDDKIVAALKSPIFYIVFIIGVFLSLNSLPLGETFFYYTDNILQTAFIIVVAIGIMRVSVILLDGVGKKFAQKTKSTLDDELMPLFKNLARIIIIFVAFMAILSTWNVNVTPFLASAGIVGIALAFAAQSTVANLFGGVSIYFDRPFKPGDRIQLETGEIGDVVEVGIRSTRINTFDDTLIVIPNEKIANSKVTNFNQPIPRMNVKINVGVAYGSDPAKVKRILLKIAKSSSVVLKTPEPVVYFTEHGDFALKFLLVVWIENPTKKIFAIDSINEGIAREFRKEKIEIPFPIQTIYLKK